MTALWTRAAAAAATGGTALGDWSGLDRIVFDSRQARPGDLFIALQDQRDGHDFIGAALEAGATAAMASRRPDELTHDAPLLMVRDVVAALEDLGRAARARGVDLRRIAVTGSAGKTSTKEMLRAVLTPNGRTHAADKSFNNHWGVPLTLAQTPADAAYGVYEIGMNHPGEITPLSRLVAPHVAIITTVAPAHLAAFDGEQGIAEAKAEIFQGLTPGGTAIINRDIPWFELLAQRAQEAGAGRIIGFGAHEQADARLCDVSADGAVAANLFGDPISYTVGASGRHHAMNSLAVLAAVEAIGADRATALTALAQWTPPEGRGTQRRIPTADGGTALLIDESYNANPASMRAALANLATAQIKPGGRRIAVLGDMLELGDDSARLHAEIGADLGCIDLAFVCGSEALELHNAAPASVCSSWAAESAALAPLVAAAVSDGDAVMIKGSAGAHMGAIIAAFGKTGA